MTKLLILIVFFGFVVCGLWGAEKINQAKDNRRYPAMGELIKLHDKEVHIVCDGAPSGTTVWFEAGAGGTSLDWSLVAPKIAKHARVCTYDRAGLGWSERRSGAHDLRAIVENLGAIIDLNSNDDQTILVGHSFGGLIAQAFARQHVGKVAGLVFVDSLDVSFYEKHADQAKLQILTMRVGSALAHFGVPRLLGLVDIPRDVPVNVEPAMLSRAFRASSIATIADEASMMPANLAYLATLPKDPRSTLATVISRQIIDGSKTELDWQESQARLVGRYQNVSHVLSKSTEHYTQLSDPNLVVNEILKLIERSAPLQR